MKFKPFRQQLRRRSTRVRAGLFRVLKNRPRRTSLRGKRAAAALIVAIIVALVVATLPAAGPASASLSFHQEADFPMLTSTERITFQPGPSNLEIRLAGRQTRPSTATPDLRARAKPHFYEVLVPLYEKAQATYGVEPKLLAAVHFVESGYSGDTTVRSSAGAQGPMQFLASTFRSYAVDGDGDGVARVTDLEDSVMTAAHYLAANGAASGNVDHALYRYNHSKAYVATVKKIANDVQL